MSFKPIKERCKICRGQLEYCDCELWACHICEALSCSDTVYLSIRKKDGRGNSCVFCSGCNNQVGWIYEFKV